MQKLILLILALAVLAGCAASPQAATPINDPTGLLVANGWTLASGAEGSPFTVPPQGSYDQTSQQLLDASKAIGFDFSGLAGKQLTVQSFPLNELATGGQAVHGNVLMDNANVVGAWLDVGGQVYALNTKP